MSDPIPSPPRSAASRPGRACVFTVLFGRYEDLTSQPVRSRSDIDFICLTDDPELRSDTWDVQVVPSFLPADPVRSAREAKIRAHRYLTSYDTSLYLDNSVLLLESPEVVLEELLPPTERLAVLEHSFRETLEDEFEAVVRSRADSALRCAEQLEHYRTAHPQILALRPLWAGLIARRHTDPLVVACMERWFTHTLRYSRRDQLSLPAALLETALVPHALRLDNQESRLHRWPVSTGRRTEVRVGAWVDGDTRLRELEARVTALEASRSWRWTAPLRAGAGALTRRSRRPLVREL